MKNADLSGLEAEQPIKASTDQSSYAQKLAPSTDKLSQEHAGALIVLHQSLTAETRALYRATARLSGFNNEELLSQSLKALSVGCTDHINEAKKLEAGHSDEDEVNYSFEGDEDCDDDEDYETTEDDDDEEEGFDASEDGSESEEDGSEDGDDDEIESITISSTQDFTAAVLELCMRDLAALKSSRILLYQAVETVLKRLDDECNAHHTADNSLKKAEAQYAQQQAILQELRRHMENIIGFHTSAAASEANGGIGNESTHAFACKPWSPQNLEIFKEACYEAVHAARDVTAGAWVSVKECITEKKIPVEDKDKGENLTMEGDEEDIVMQPKQESVNELSESEN